MIISTEAADGPKQGMTLEEIERFCQQVREDMAATGSPVGSGVSKAGRYSCRWTPPAGWSVMRAEGGAHRLRRKQLVWSPSMVAKYTSCPRMWALQYGILTPFMASARQHGKTSEHQRRQPSLASRLGTLAHHGMQAPYEVAASAPLRVIGATMDRYIPVAFEAIDARAVELDIDEMNVALVKDDVLHTLRILPVPLPKAILGVEQRVQVNLPGGTPMRGDIDLALWVGRKAVHIRDWKRIAVNRLPSPDELLSDGKMAFYAYSQYITGVADGVSVGLYSLRDQREVYREMSYGTAKAVVERQEAIIRTAETDGVLRPTPRGGNCQRCPVIAACPLWANGKRPPGY